MLIDCGYHVETVGSGREALSVVTAYRPDVILLDLRMPDMPGETVLQRFGILDPSVPVVIVSGNQDEDVARETLAMGAFDYITKPFAVQTLERVVSAAIVGRANRHP